jgi:hypothetical protein
MRVGTSARASVTKADNDRNKLSSLRPSAKQIARRLITSRPSQSPAAHSAARAAAAATDHLYRELSRWVGHDGCHALLTRALTEARTEWPALRRVHLHPRSDPYVDGVAEAITADGDPATAEALESMIIRLVELLSRLIGEDMTMMLMERSLSPAKSAEPSLRSRQEEA